MGPVIIYIMGVSGSGKTTIGKKLSARTGIPFFDGDEFHSADKVEKMKAGRPLTDDDRAKWLARINDFAKNQTKTEGAIIACSALKEKYRRMLSLGIAVPVVWVFLRGNYELIEQRMQARRDHFMPASLLTSQFATLEPPQNAITVDIGNEPDKIVDLILTHLSS